MTTIRVQFFLGCWDINIESMLVTKHGKRNQQCKANTFFCYKNSCHCVAHARAITSNEKIAWANWLQVLSTQLSLYVFQRKLTEYHLTELLWSGEVISLKSIIIVQIYIIQTVPYYESAYNLIQLPQTIIESSDHIQQIDWSALTARGYKVPLVGLFETWTDIKSWVQLL